MYLHFIFQSKLSFKHTNKVFKIQIEKSFKELFILIHWKQKNEFIYYLRPFLTNYIYNNKLRDTYSNICFFFFILTCSAIFGIVQIFLKQIIPLNFRGTTCLQLFHFAVEPFMKNSFQDWLFLLTHCWVGGPSCLQLYLILIYMYNHPYQNSFEC